MNAHAELLSGRAARGRKGTANARPGASSVPDPSGRAQQSVWVLMSFTLSGR
ncbi:hypothetical protein DB30_07932 [Enhygromyxa salina]|uniref:Uncharacterized protein n=1 Tax=Enhygromyxa salina TaxID=215803 RepID=A0A0C2CQZ7_9BACT|nr:hypothetical protein DB30_07932 [Enhygromyxa salina]